MQKNKQTCGSTVLLFIIYFNGNVCTETTQCLHSGVKFRDFTGFNVDSRTLITSSFVLSAVFPALKMNH